ncbi:MAG: glycosyltransferase family 4 protein [Candidatus Omnitrophota bacterium]
MGKFKGVCILTGAFYPEISGGGGVQAQTLIRALDKQFSFYVITTCRDYSLPKEGLIEGVPVFRVMLKLGNAYSLIRSFFSFIGIFMKLEKKVDILHLQGFSTKAIIFIVLGKIFKKKIIQTMQLLGDDDPLSIRNNRFGKVLLFFFSKSDVFVSLSPAITQSFLKSPLSNRKLLTIPNGVDVEKFSPLDDNNIKQELRKSLGLPESNIIILFIGVFALHKGANLLLEAWKKIRDSQSRGVSIIFIGSTDPTHFAVSSNLVNKFNLTIAESNMNNEIFLIEKTLEIEKYYRASDIFVLASRREGLPNVLLEAMSCGLGCIATRIRGITDYVISDKKDGLLFEMDNSDDLSLKLNELLHNEKLIHEVGNNARKAIINNFSIQTISKENARLYNELTQVNEYNS